MFERCLLGQETGGEGLCLEESVGEASLKTCQSLQLARETLETPADFLILSIHVTLVKVRVVSRQ